MDTMKGIRKGTKKDISFARERRDFRGQRIYLLKRKDGSFRTAKLLCLVFLFDFGQSLFYFGDTGGIAGVRTHELRR